jgi:hypothetical protein
MADINRLGRRSGSRAHVILKNGSVITGTLISKTGDTLVIDTDTNTGRQEIFWKDIETLKEPSKK